MKKFLFFFVFMLVAAFVFIPVAFAQDVGDPVDSAGMGFESFSALVALTAMIIPFVVELFKLIPGLPSIVKQILSWLIGVLAAFAGWQLNLGFLGGLDWYIALLYGFGAGLIANGVFDTGIVTYILGIFGIKGDTGNR